MRGEFLGNYWGGGGGASITRNNSGYHSPGFISRVTISGFAVPLFSKWVLILCYVHTIVQFLSYSYSISKIIIKIIGYT